MFLNRRSAGWHSHCSPAKGLSSAAGAANRQCPCGAPRAGNRHTCLTKKHNRWTAASPTHIPPALPKKKARRGRISLAPAQRPPHSLPSSHHLLESARPLRWEWMGWDGWASGCAALEHDACAHATPATAADGRLRRRAPDVLFPPPLLLFCLISIIIITCTPGTAGYGSYAQTADAQRTHWIPSALLAILPPRRNLSSAPLVLRSLVNKEMKGRGPRGCSSCAAGATPCVDIATMGKSTCLICCRRQDDWSPTGGCSSPLALSGTHLTATLAPASIRTATMHT